MSFWTAGRMQDKATCIVLPQPPERHGEYEGRISAGISDPA